MAVGVKSVLYSPGMPETSKLKLDIDNPLTLAVNNNQRL